MWAAIVDTLRDPSQLIAWGGYPALAAVIFLETGALVFFLPGDSLLVMAGFFAARGELSLATLNVLLVPLAVLGDACSYVIGRQLGPRLFSRPQSRLLDPAHLRAAQAFYDTHGGRAIVLARFIPVVRTFVPVIAGLGRMHYPRFAAYNVVGAAVWVGGMTGLGYLLGDRLPGLLAHVDLVLLAIIGASVLPMAVAALRGRLARRPPG